MASLYLDHDVAVRLVPSLAVRGHMVRHARDEGQARAGDEAILLYAARRGWILVTHNRADFRLLHAAWQCWRAAWRITEQHAGILIIEQRPTDELEPVRDRLLRAAPPLAGTLYAWTRTNGWRRQVVG
jgi:hypothetical protein